MIDFRTLAEEFSPVDHFCVEDEIPSSGLASGFAAPARGPKCCVIAIASGDEILAVSRASSFSPAAREKNIRLGWGGFTISGLAQAIASGTDPELKCLVSGKTLKQWSGEELSEKWSSDSFSWVNIQDVRMRLQLEQGCRDVEQVVEFAMDFRAKHGPEALLNISYRYLLQRDLDDGGRSLYFQSFPDTSSILRTWNTIMDSNEFAMRSRGYLAGPFEPGFPFPLSVFDVASRRLY